MLWLLLPLAAAAALALRGNVPAPVAEAVLPPPPPSPDLVPPVQQQPAPKVPSAPGASPAPDLGAAVAAVGVGAGIGTAVAQVLDSNQVVTAVATAGGAAVGGAAVLAGTAIAGMVAAPAVAAVAILRLGQDLWEKSVGREDLLRAYRERLAEAERKGGPAGREAERQLVMRENARQYIDLMRAPRVIPESDQQRLQYLTTRGRILSDAYGVNAIAELVWEGHTWDWRNGSLEPVRKPSPPSTPTAATVARVAATRLGVKEP